MNTYSYPVVSYINKDGKASDRPSLISSLPGSDDYSEAVVWDQVQQRDVATLCVEGGFLDWGILLTIIDQIFRESTDYESATKATRRLHGIVNKVLQLGGLLELPDGNAYDEADYSDSIELHTVTIIYDPSIISDREKIPCFYGGYGEDMAFYAVTPDVNEAIKIFKRQKLFYNSVFAKAHASKNHKMFFTNGTPSADDEHYSQTEMIVEALNGKRG